MRPLLVGESNPYGADPRFALYPLPEQSAGGRLCRLVLCMRMAEYLRAYDRANLCVGKWAQGAARTAAETLLSQRGQGTYVLLGARVSRAFCGTFDPFTWQRSPGTTGSVFVTLPHPSGLCRVWNEPGAFERARAALRAAGCPVGGAP